MSSTDNINGFVYKVDWKAALPFLYMQESRKSAETDKQTSKQTNKQLFPLTQIYKTATRQRDVELVLSFFYSISNDLNNRNTNSITLRDGPL